MAKVYDALKRIEAERSQHAALTTAYPQHAAELVSPSLWKRWFGTKALHSVPERPSHPDDLLQERLRVLVARIEAIETRAAAPAPDIAERLHVVDDKLAALELNLVKRMSDVADHMTQTTAPLNTRIWVLFGLVGLALLALLFRV
jgi:hypothetical protein